MEVREIKIGGKVIKNNLFSAPMAGYTAYPFRQLILELGAGLTYTELVSAKGLFFGGKGSAELLYSGKGYKNTAAQIFGADAYYMRKACESDFLKDFDIIDINMGCPVPKVYKNGEGSALLCDAKKASEIIKECVKSGKIITVKIRTGINRGDDIAEEFSKMAEDSGASAVTIHGRVREDYYSGEPDYKAIYKAKRAVNIPIIANGGIFTVDDADKMVEETGADGIMIARGQLFNPFIFCELLEKKPPFDIKTLIKRQLTEAVKLYGEKRAVNEFKKFVPCYYKGVKDAKSLKIALMSAETAEEIILLTQNF